MRYLNIPICSLQPQIFLYLSPGYCAIWKSSRIAILKGDVNPGRSEEIGLIILDSYHRSISTDFYDRWIEIVAHLRSVCDLTLSKKCKSYCCWFSTIKVMWGGRSYFFESTSKPAKQRRKLLETRIIRKPLRFRRIELLEKLLALMWRTHRKPCGKTYRSCNSEWFYFRTHLNSSAGCWIWRSCVFWKLFTEDFLRIWFKGTISQRKEKLTKIR